MYFALAQGLVCDGSQNHWGRHQNCAAGLAPWHAIGETSGRRHVRGGIWEVRARLDNRIARVLFVLSGSTMVLLHGFIKKQQETPKADLDLAIERLKELKRK